MKPIDIQILLLFLGAAVPAQQVFVNADAVSPIVVEATLGGVVASHSQPAGPLGFLGHLQAQTANFEAVATASWSSWASSVDAFFDLDIEAIATAPGATATSGEHEVLLHFSGIGLTTADLELSATVVSTAGSPTPLVRVDVFDDGLVELSEVNPSNSVAVNLGNGPIPVRVRAGAEAPSGGIEHVALRVRLVPHNNLYLSTVVQGCGSGSFLTATPSFVGTGIDFRIPGANVQDPHVLVLGLAAAPVALPPIAGLPCILLPEPDALILFLYASQSEHVSIPPAVHPLLLFAQGAHLEANGIGLTDGLLVNAY